LTPATSPSSANNYNEMLKNAKDDNYYLERNLEPPRFELYKIARRLMIETYNNNNKNKKHVPGILKTEDLDDYMPVYDAMTQDEFDYDLKRKLMHTTPEQRYQSRKETYYFHELYRDNGEYGCNPTARPEICVPECRYYNEMGGFEDDELVAEHKKMVEFFNKHNGIIEIEIGEDNNSFRIKQVRKYDMQQQPQQQQQQPDE
ncbi:MAG: hypothetical protein WA421_06540, partial [Nitrososphaeraceae archaeon]